MRSFARAALAALTFCVAATATISAPSVAMDAPDGSVTTASAMLAAVTAPLLAVDLKTLEANKPDFSTPPTDQSAVQPADPAVTATTLDALVDANAAASADDADMRCLATTVYYESKGEPLSGQLAVAQTIVNRTHSNIFPETVCDVVRQPGQFSFLRGGQLPTAPTGTSAWQHAVAIARIAHDGLWKQVAPAALFFHARRVSPGWGKVRVASIGNHVFFR